MFGSANEWNRFSVIDMPKEASRAEHSPATLPPLRSSPVWNVAPAHPPAMRRRAASVGAIMSTTWSWTACSAGALIASRTAFSAQSAFRFHRSASDRMNAAASFVTFSFSIAPVTPTGWAAPMFVPGAIALIGQDSMMNVPAEAARAPDGAV